MTDLRRVLIVLGAAAVLASGYIHFYLYFRGGYRGIAPESVLGITISRSFVLQAIAAVVIAELLVLSLRLGALEAAGVVLGIVFTAGSIVAFVLSRTSGLLGFTEDQLTTESVIALVSEVIGLAALVAVAIVRRAGSTPATATSAP